MPEPVRTRDRDSPAPPPPDPSPPVVPDHDVTPLGRWQELRTLLLDPERRRLRAVEQRLEDPGLHADAVSRVLPDALRRRGTGDRELNSALGPVVGEAIKASIRQNPQPLVDAVFPIMGPAIRRAIATAFAELAQSLNTALEHSLTPRGIAWRIEAARTGRSFGEVVLRHSLVYRAEQVFVIHPESGLLIDHLTAPGIHALSPDMVAGMLTAIVDFARDSFHVSQQEGLDSLELGDLTVWIERGPTATLAAVVRGHAPVAYRETLQRAVEELHRIHASDIASSAASGHTFSVRAGILEPCLVSQLQRKSSSGMGRLAIVAGILLLSAGWCAVPRMLDARRFDRYLQALRTEPGIVVGSSARRDGRFVVSGLRDPIAQDPQTLLATNGLDTSQVTGHWEPYIALRPEFVVRRAANALRPPTGVELAVRADTLVLVGVAPEAWRARAAQLFVAIAGVGAIDTSGLRDSLDVALQAQVDRIGRMEITFETAQTTPDAIGAPRLDSLAVALRQLTDEATAHGRVVTTEVIGSADSVGSPALNAPLRLARARAIRQRLVAAGVGPRAITTAADSTDASRRAQLVVTIRPAPSR